MAMQLVFDVVATDPNSADRATIYSAAIPSTATLADCVYSGSTCTRRFYWTPLLGQSDINVCFTAENQAGLKYNGQYCITLQKSPASIIYLSGVSFVS